MLDIAMVPMLVSEHGPMRLAQLSDGHDRHGNIRHLEGGLAVCTFFRNERDVLFALIWHLCFVGSDKHLPLSLALGLSKGIIQEMPLWVSGMFSTTCVHENKHFIGSTLEVSIYIGLVDDINFL